MIQGVLRRERPPKLEALLEELDESLVKAFPGPGAKRPGDPAALAARLVCLLLLLVSCLSPPGSRLGRGARLVGTLDHAERAIGVAGRPCPTSCRATPTPLA